MTSISCRLLTVLALAAVLATNAASQTAQRRRYINLPNRTVQAPFSDAVVIGNTMYLAGRIGLDPATGQAPANLETEVRLLLDGMKATLASGGMTMDDLVTVQVFCPDLALYDRFNAIYSTYFKDKFPARAFIGSGPLLRGGHFEATAIAVKE
jgi:2-iminobutanoate/2-iminopropanoate deaminase